MVNEFRRDRAGDLEAFHRLIVADRIGRARTNHAVGRAGAEAEAAKRGLHGLDLQRIAGVPALGAEAAIGEGDRRLGLPLGGLLAGFQRLRHRDARAQVLHFLLGARIACIGGHFEPEQCLGQVLRRTDAFGVHDAEIVLRIDEAKLGGFVEPGHRIGFGLRAAFAFGEEQRVVVHRVDVSGFGSLLDQVAGFDHVLVDALAALVELAEFVLGGRDAFLRGAAQEGGGGFEVALRELHLRILVLGDGVAGIGFGLNGHDDRDGREGRVAAHSAFCGLLRRLGLHGRYGRFQRRRAAGFDGFCGGHDRADRGLFRCQFHGRFRRDFRGGLEGGNHRLDGRQDRRLRLLSLGGRGFGEREDLAAFGFGRGSLGFAKQGVADDCGLILEQHLLRIGWRCGDGGGRGRGGGCAGRRIDIGVDRAGQGWRDRLLAAQVEIAADTGAGDHDGGCGEEHRHAGAAGFLASGLRFDRQRRGARLVARGLFRGGHRGAAGAGDIVGGRLFRQRVCGRARLGFRERAGEVRLVVEDVGLAGFGLAVFEAVADHVEAVEFGNGIKAFVLFRFGVRFRGICDIGVDLFGADLFRRLRVSGHQAFAGRADGVEVGLVGADRFLVVDDFPAGEAGFEFIGVIDGGEDRRVGGRLVLDFGFEHRGRFVFRLGIGGEHRRAEVRLKDGRLRFDMRRRGKGLEALETRGERRDGALHGRERLGGLRLHPLKAFGDAGERVREAGV